ncbi:Uncharacterized protein FWK35_00022448 [Aphis craccivora]|uniref:Uncharacterized protein n=1 Tax=Aphis craccivora TaxID=307492 RepID=A0A6G0Y8P6_APHCR|nr:Uncharacterized protein FWK35_00022448 [Aphis craccivora]
MDHLSEGMQPQLSINYLGRGALVNFLRRVEKVRIVQKKIMNSYTCVEDKKPIPYSIDEALALLVDNKLTKQQYVNIRLEITESGCKIPLQDLLDHTTNRIIQIPQYIRPIESHMNNLEVLYKWGCDGSSETKESTKEEVEDIEIQINKLVATNITHNGINLNIQHKLIFSMVDGKIGRTQENIFGKKKKIQDEFRSEMGLLVDIVLKASGYEINTEAFKNYCLYTAKYYITLYPWFYMPASVHKILIHGADVIQHALLPIGQLYEEAQECRNKDFKIFRQHHSRKNSRINNNEDLVHMLCVSPDPVISSLRNTVLFETGYNGNNCHEMMYFN